jgi:hypothetical protein
MNKTKNILIIGDSSIPPRKETPYQYTYSTLLKKMYINARVESSSKTGMSSRYIYKKLDPLMLYGYNPDVVILNYGIVDVYPRPYPNIVYKLLACSGLLTYVDKFLKKTKLYYRLGDFFNFKEVSLQKFEIYSESIIQKLLERRVEKIIIIGIIKPYKVLLKSKKVYDEIERYNEVYKKLSYKYKEVKYIDIYEESDEDFTIWDGYHYTKKASKYLSETIEKLIYND